MLGEHRPALADLLWERAHVIIKSLQAADSKEDSEGAENTRFKTIITDDQILLIHKTLREIKTPEDILARAKAILRKHYD
jgi:hypothetical protein